MAKSDVPQLMKGMLETLRKLEFPAVVDEMDDAVGAAYGAMPERLYLVGRDGRIAYKGGIGPMFFRPPEWEEAIERYLGGGSA